MMDRSEVQAIADRELPRLQRETGLDGWTVEVKCGACNDPTDMAQAVTELDYLRAWITLDHDHHDDEAEVVDSLLHELGHVLTAPFDLLIQSARQAIGEDSMAARLLDRIYRHASESTVINFERLMAAQKELRSGSHETLDTGAEG